MALGTVKCLLLINQVVATCALPHTYDTFIADSNSVGELRSYGEAFTQPQSFTGFMQIEPGSEVPEGLNLASIPHPSDKPDYTPPKQLDTKVRTKTASSAVRIKKSKKKPSNSREAIESVTGTVDGSSLRESPVVAALFPTSKRGLAKLLEDTPKSKNRGSPIMAKVDGNEVTDCLKKQKKLWNAMLLVHKKFGTLYIESGYRSRKYNDALRAKGKGAAKNSYHIKCMAIDFRVKGASIGTLWKYVKQLQKQGKIGGVGRYSRWVHMDSGPTRSW